MPRRIPNLLIGLAFLCASCSGSEQRATDLGGKAQALADAGDLVSARRTIAEAIAERDDIAALYLLQGQLALRANAPTEAYNAFSNALTLDASNPVALQSVAQLALGFGRNEVAEETADRILALQPEQPDAMFVKGLAQLERHRPEVADKLAESILQRAPRDERGLALKARVLFFQGRPDEAIERIERNSDVGTRTVLLSWTLLELYREDGRGPQAAAELAHFLATHPDDLDARLDQANVLYRIGDVSAARAQLRAVFAKPAISPRLTDKILGLWRFFDADPYAGVRSPVILDANTRHAVARFYLEADNDGRALNLLSGDSSPTSEALRVRIAARTSSDPAIERNASTMLRRDATQCDALVARASVRRRTDDVAGAIRDAQRAAAECPDDPGTALELGAAFRARRDLVGELRAYDDGLTNDPQSLPLARVAFDRSLEAGKLTRAVAVARRLTRAAPSTAPGWEMLTQACSIAQDSACLTSARAGLAKARSALRRDPRPGEILRGGPLGELAR